MKMFQLSDYAWSDSQKQVIKKFYQKLKQDLQECRNCDEFPTVTDLIERRMGDFK